MKLGIRLAANAWGDRPAIEATLELALPKGMSEQDTDKLKDHIDLGIGFDYNHLLEMEVFKPVIDEVNNRLELWEEDETVQWPEPEDYIWSVVKL